MVEKRAEKDRADRLAAALRDNLKRRKAQARAKTAQSSALPAGASSAARPEEERASAEKETATKMPKKR